MAFIRFRRRERDAGSDADRIRAIQNAYTSSIASAQAEAHGLHLRIASHSTSAGLLFGTNIESQTATDPTTDDMLKVAEGSIMRAEQRLKELDAHICLLKSASAQFEAAVRVPTGPRPG
jgi:hypothetical protein